MQKKKKKKNLDPDLTTFIQINSKLIRVLSVKCKTIKLVEDKIGEILDDLEYGDDILILI